MKDAVKIKGGFTGNLLPLAFVLIVVGIAASTLGGKRNLDFMAAMIQDITVELKNETIIILQIISLIIVLSSILILAEKVRVISFEVVSLEVKRLLIALFGYFFFNVILNSIIGNGQIQPNNIYSILIFLAVGMSPGNVISLALDSVKKALLIFFIIGFIYIFVDQSSVIQRSYEGWFPYIDIRFYGLAAHANSAGPLALVMLLLEELSPSKNNKLRRSIILIGVLALFLSQSKTSWFAALISIMIIVWYRLDISKKIPLSRVVIPLLIISVVVFINLSLFFEINSILSHGLDDQTMTLSGRSSIWEVAIDEWVRSPFFGYGSTLWNEDFRHSIDMMFAFHAHNQILQILSTAGLVGFLFFSIYVVALMTLLLVFSKETKGVTGSFCALLIAESISEIPFLMTNILTAEVLIHLILFSIIVRQSNAARNKFNLYRSI